MLAKAELRRFGEELLKHARFGGAPAAPGLTARAAARISEP